MTTMQIVRRGLIAGLAAASLAPTSAMATHNTCDRPIEEEPLCPITYFKVHHVDPVYRDVVTPVRDEVLRLAAGVYVTARDMSDAALCFYFGLNC